MINIEIDGIWCADNDASRDEYFRIAMQNLDIKAYAFGIDFKSRDPERLLCNYRSDWQKRYMDLGLYEIDPTIDIGLRADQAMTWKEISGCGYGNNVFRAASDFGISNGTTLPIRVGNTKSILSVAQSLTLPQEQELLYLANCYIRATIPFRPAGHIGKLSTKDFLFLCQVCDGHERKLTNAQIATEIGLSSRDVAERRGVTMAEEENFAKIVELLKTLSPDHYDIVLEIMFNILEKQGRPT